MLARGRGGGGELHVSRGGNIPPIGLKSGQKQYLIDVPSVLEFLNFREFF